MFSSFKKLGILILLPFMVQCDFPTHIKIDPVDVSVVGELVQVCPVGETCDENYLYHAYSGEVDSLHFYFSFQPQILSNKTTAGAIENFNYVYFHIRLPSLADGNTIYTYGQNAVRGVPVAFDSISHTIDAFENDVLSGRIDVEFDRLTKTTHSNDPNCRTGDILGICSEDLYWPREYRISYKLKLTE